MFPQIYKGKPFKPDMARDNAVIERLNRLDGVSEHFQRSKNASFSINATPAQNWSGTRLAGTAVGFNIREKSEYSAVIEPYANHQFWGVLLENCDGENAASVIVSGIAEVAVSGAATGMFATPNADGTFSLSDDGIVPVLQHDVEANTALVVIGAGGGGDVVTDDYRGQFKVVIGSNTKSVKIVNGAKPNSNYCGTTDIFESAGWNGNVPAQEIPVSANEVFFCVTKPSENYYEVNFSASGIAENVLIYVRIATLTRDGNGNIIGIEQVFRSTEGLFLSGRYVL